MILEYSFENFLSFKEQVYFSMLTPGSKVKNRFPYNYVNWSDSYDINKVAVIVGENAGGKSNFIKSLKYFKSFFEENGNVSSRRYTLNSNMIQDTCPKNSITTQKFHIILTGKQNQIFEYDLEIDYCGIAFESLYLRNNKNTKPLLVFKLERKEVETECFDAHCDHKKCNVNISNSSDIEVNEKFLSSGIKTALENNMDQNNSIGLFVTKLAIVGCEPAIQFTKHIINSISAEFNTKSYDIYKKCMNDHEDIEILKDERYLDIFKQIDYSISKIEIDEEDPFIKTKIHRKNENGNSLITELIDDSSGVCEFFAWAIQIFKVIYQDKTILVDEMDSVLNPILSNRIVSYINGSEHKGQFIFTTHNVLHLDLKKYMKEQIYFVTKDPSTLESEMYSLSEFADIRYETTKIYDLYLKGILGGTASE